MEKIGKIAVAMYRGVHKQGATQRKLERGLTVTLRIEESVYMLSLTRLGSEPSEKEAEVCRAAFGVPEWATLHRGIVREYRVLRYRWDSRQFVRNVKMGQAHLKGVDLC